MRIGIDLGGTKIEGVALDSDGHIAARIRTPTPQGDYPATVAAIVKLVYAVENAANIATGPHISPTPVGIGIPGALAPDTGLIKNANSTCLIGQPLDQELSKRLNRPIRLANDADCFTLSEATDGAAAGKNSVFGVIIGTGVGGGIVIQGQPLCGPNALTGEWGHNPLPWPDENERPGPPCYCGQNGCIETFCSGPGLSLSFEKAHGHPLPPLKILSLADQGDPRAEDILSLYESRLARALASVINILDPEVIVLGGGLSNLTRLYQNIPRLLPRHVFSHQVTTPIIKARFGDSSGVRGAAWLFDD
ncbi:MAG: ROK family protein [Magnetococcales bacterium]|nr:ROK family protein [Magnetococcales bacterium]